MAISMSSLLEQRRRRVLLLLCFILLYFFSHSSSDDHVIASGQASVIVERCKYLNVKPRPPPDFYQRSASDRFEHGTQSTLVKNATIWSGDGVISGDILLEKGIIKSIGDLSGKSSKDVNVIEANGSWATPGIVDMHSHLGVYSAPALSGAADGNSRQSPILPWLRSVDGLNTHDDAYALSISGGVTTANVLPGSANAIGGQAFTIKLRPTSERSTSSMLLEPPFSLNSTAEDPRYPRWRQMKHACGENPSRVYGFTRMDTIWSFRNAYETARKIRDSQDAFCAKVLDGDLEYQQDAQFPESLQWEALVDVLRGRVKVHNHCYEAVDLDGMVRLTNEFKFSIAAFHHAHETYLVPDLLKKAYNGPPAAALFAVNARYKRESYRGSEFAPRILADNGIPVVMKSDHPVLNSRFLLHEAQQAYYYGLDADLALASVTSTPASILGLGHRIGFVRTGYDADVVLWDSHPLQLGATPTQVFIDGIAQLKKPYFTRKPLEVQVPPKVPNFDEEAQKALDYEGLPPLVQSSEAGETVVFSNVREVHGVPRLLDNGNVVVKDGEIVCSGTCHELVSNSSHIVDLEGGVIQRGLVSFGAPLGLAEIRGELSTQDGILYDPLSGNPSKILGESGTLIMGVDGLQFRGRDALLAYREGVITAVTPPQGLFLAGLATAFDVGAPHALADGAIIQRVTAVHVQLSESNVVSVSTQIAALRRLLLETPSGIPGDQFRRVREGKTRLVVHVHSADIMATLIELKREIDGIEGSSIQMTFAGAEEAHLIASHIGQAGVGVILSPSRPYPTVWESRRILPGPPISRETAVTVLKAHNVIVGLGTPQAWQARNIRWDAAWAHRESHETLSVWEALALVSDNLENLLGVEDHHGRRNLVAVRGGHLLDPTSRVAGVISPRRRLVDLFV